MNRHRIPAAPPIPELGASHPYLPYRFVDRGYMVIVYESEAAAIRAAVPEPLIPDPSNRVSCEWIRMANPSGVGDHTRSSVVIACSFHGRPCDFATQMYADDDPPHAVGFARKHARPNLAIARNTLVGTLDHAGRRIATGTVAYKHALYDGGWSNLEASLRRPRCRLKVIPNIDGGQAIAQLVGVEPADVTVKGSWSGPARLDLVPHVDAPVADLPVRRIIGGRHFVADLTLPADHVLVDYLEHRDLRQAA
ncbi:MAG: acetoacetate decarboxylase [Alphaproteobacteria bacterium]|nr:acetoacetate decarboxylase [Alphaproteobacteria bacterium]